MARSPFGWDYPAGAENDPNAPYNQRDVPIHSHDFGCPECEGTNLCATEDVDPCGCNSCIEENDVPEPEPDGFDWKGRWVHFEVWIQDAEWTPRPCYQTETGGDGPFCTLDRGHQGRHQSIRGSWA